MDTDYIYGYGIFWIHSYVILKKKLSATRISGRKAEGHLYCIEVLIRSWRATVFKEHLMFDFAYKAYMYAPFLVEIQLPYAIDNRYGLQ
jgi:hypothetical protein